MVLYLFTLALGNAAATHIWVLLQLSRPVVMAGYVYNRACIKVRLKISRTEVNDQFIGNAKINTVVLDNIEMPLVLLSYFA